jgi:hypothetical protein
MPVKQFRSPLMTGAPPKNHQPLHLSDGVKAKLREALRVMKATANAENALVQVEFWADRYRQSLLKVTAYPAPAIQVANADQVIKAVDGLVDSLNDMDSETRKRVRYSLGRGAENDKRKARGKKWFLALLRDLGTVKDAAENAKGRAQKYCALGRTVTDPALTTLAIELGRIWEEVTGKRLRASRSRVPKSEQLRSRVGAERLFFSAVIVDALGIELREVGLDYLLDRARKAQKLELRKRSEESVASDDDRFDELADNDDERDEGNC